MNTNTADVLARTLAQNTPNAGAWDTLPISDLSRDGLVDGLSGIERLLAHVQALELRYLAALAEARTGDPLDCTEEEVTAAVRWSPNTARHRLEFAHTLNTVFPETLALMDTGHISWPQATALVEITSGLEPETARAAQARVLPRMPQQSAAATRKALHRAVLALDAQAAHTRHVLETRRRRVVLYPEPDGIPDFGQVHFCLRSRSVLVRPSGRPRVWPYARRRARGRTHRRYSPWSSTCCKGGAHNAAVRALRAVTAL